MFKKFIAVSTAIFFCMPAVANASSAPPGTVSGLWAVNSGVFMFDLSTDKTQLPNCPGISAVPHRWAIDSTKPSGQAMIAIVMSAYMNNKHVAISGTHGCDLWSDTESVWYLQQVD